MPLQLTGSWEHALLAATVKAASVPGSTGFLGRTALQKIVYFLQISGVPMRYKFDILHYGTFCDRIPQDVEWLMADGVVSDVSANQEKYSKYQPGPAIDELLSRHHHDLEQYQSVIDSVVKTLLPWRPEELELFATLDYIFRQFKAGGGSGPWKERVVTRFLEIKKDKFPKDRVSAAYDSMVNTKLIEA